MRLSAVILERDERAALRELGRLGAVELIHTRSGPDTAPLVPHDRSADIARWDRIKSRTDELRRSLEISSPSGATRQTISDLNQVETTLAYMEETASHPLNSRQRLTEQQNQLSALYEQLSGYYGFDVPLDGLDRFSFLHFVTGTVPVENIEKLQKVIGKNTVLASLDQQKGRQAIITMTTRTGRADLKAYSAKRTFIATNFPRQKAQQSIVYAEKKNWNKNR